jgi:recombinational DNA repair protein (RecF pathway)
VYQKYLTPAIVISSRDAGEADRSFALYTERFGLVWARASAVRRSTSKMRMALPLYAGATVSLIKGAAGWRVAGAQATRTPMSIPVERVGGFARIAQLVMRLVHGEEEHQHLYEVLAGAQQCLFETDLSDRSIELLCVARVLHSLGYVPTSDAYGALLRATDYGIESLHTTHTHADVFASMINRALRETHL